MSSIQTTETELDWAKEFKVGEGGSVTGSRRGTARLCGVDQRTISRLAKGFKEGGAQYDSPALQSFVGQEFEGGALPEILMSAIIAHYAFLWNQAYHELEYRFGYSIARSRAKNKLEKIEADEQLPNLIATMQVIWETKI